MIFFPIFWPIYRQVFIPRKATFAIRAREHYSANKSNEVRIEWREPKCPNPANLWAKMQNFWGPMRAESCAICKQTNNSLNWWLVGVDQGCVPSENSRDGKRDGTFTIKKYGTRDGTGHGTAQKHGNRGTRDAGRDKLKKSLPKKFFQNFLHFL